MYHRIIRKDAKINDNNSFMEGYRRGFQIGGLREINNTKYYINVIIVLLLLLFLILSVFAIKSDHIRVFFNDKCLPIFTSAYIDTECWKTQ